MQQWTVGSRCLQLHLACCCHSHCRSGHCLHRSTAAMVCISDPLHLDARAASVQCVETHMWACHLDDVTVVAMCGQAMCARRASGTAFRDWPSATATFILDVGSSLCILVFSCFAFTSAVYLQGFKVLLSSFRGNPAELLLCPIPAVYTE